MSSLQRLEELLTEQFGPFIRDDRYKAAFDQAMKSLRTMNEPVAGIDLFYLFLHQLVMELFEEIDRLHEKLANT